MSYYVSEQFIYEIIEDFKLAETEQEKKEIVSAFCNKLWRTHPLGRRAVRHIKFDVWDTIPDEYRELFSQYSDIPYNTYRQNIESTEPLCMLKQKLNNVYEMMCDKQVCIDKEYLRALGEPKRLYYQQFMECAHERPSVDVLEIEIDNALRRASEIFSVTASRKIAMTWEQYQRFVEKKMFRIFTNYRTPEWGTGNGSLVRVDYVDEDHYAVAYIGKSINGYLQNEHRRYLGVKAKHQLKPCPSCGVGFVEADSRRRTCVFCGTRKVPVEEVPLVCDECGKTFFAGSKSRLKTKCPDCYKVYRMAKNRTASKKYRDKKLQKPQNE